jgi:transposase
MRKIREVLRLRFQCGQTGEAISAAVGIAPNTVSGYLARATRAGLTWELAETMPDHEVETRLFPPIDPTDRSPFATIDFAWVHRELRRHGVTLLLLWGEYAEAAQRHGGDGARPYQYSQFCDRYAQYRRVLSPTMRQTHRAGEKLFTSSTTRASAPRSSTARPARSSTSSSTSPCSVPPTTPTPGRLARSSSPSSSARRCALEYFGAAPEMLVPDQLRSAVSKPHRIEPEINATFAEMGRHYGCAVVPARPRKPRDKASVEVGVQIAQRWILACLRNERFFSLDALNRRIRELLECLNTRPFQRKDDCRRTAFETLDRPAMRPLPPTRFELGEWKLGVGVGIDYCILLDHRPYSVPSALIGHRVDVRITASVVEVFHDHACVALHARSFGRKGLATIYRHTVRDRIASTARGRRSASSRGPPRSVPRWAS